MRNRFSLFLFGVLAFTGCVPEAETENEPPLSEEPPNETPRKILHEVFSGSTCGPCYDADLLLLGLFENNPGRYVHLGYQVGSDPYVSSEAVSRRMYYVPGEETYSIPYVHVDGVNGFHPIEMNEEKGYTQADFDAFAAVPSQVELTVSHSIVGQSVDIAVEAVPLADFESEDVVLHVAIIEGTTHLNVGTNGLTEFHHVMKKMVPDQNGSPIGPMSRGESIQLEFSYEFQGGYDETAGYSNPIDHSTAHTVEEFEDLSVVVFLQDNGTWEVLQSAWSGE
jgi:hypothetical protein